MSNLNDLTNKLFRAIDDSNSYSMDDFYRDANNYKNQSHKMGDEIKIEIKIKNESINPLPDYATIGSSGFDIRANLSEQLIIKSGKVAIVSTGLYFELPDDMEIQIRSRSGLAAKNSVVVLNSPGTIDSDYRGELKIILINLGENDFEISNGDRIAQGVISTFIGKKYINFVDVKDISSDTLRGSGGLGSTGLQ